MNGSGRFGARPWDRAWPADIPRSLTYPDLPAWSILFRNLPHHAHRTALCVVDPKTAEERSALTYGALASLARSLACGLAAAGVGRGDRVAFFLPNAPALVVSYFGAWLAGAVAVPCNPMYTSAELETQLADANPALLIAASSLSGAARGAAERLGIPLFVVPSDGGAASRPAGTRSWAELIADDDGFRPPPLQPAEDLALLMYTGGTTGVPKGAMLTHRNIVVNTIQFATWYGLREAGESCIAALPMFHSGGMAGAMNVPLYAGATLLVFERFSAEGVAAAIARYRCTRFFGVPAMYAAVLALPHVRDYDFSSLRACRTSAAPLPVRTKEAFDALVGREVLVEGYGLSETSPLAAANPVGRSKPGCIGIPLPDTDAAILDPASGEPVAPGTAGELVLRGPQVMRGYWKRPAETADAFAGGWFHTGDIARLDPEGYLAIVGRLKDLINTAGYKVWPREVEEVLYRHPGVRLAAVLGRPDPDRGERVTAVVVPQEGTAVTAEELVAHCGKHLAPYKVPRSLELRSALPMSGAGKILKGALREPAPTDPWERTLIGMWREVLGVEDLRPDDNFFAHGGDSLRATALCARLEAATGRILSPAAVLREPTIARLAAALKASAGDSTRQPSPLSSPFAAACGDPQHLSPDSDEGAPLSFAQQRFWFLHHLDPEGSAYNMVRAFRLRGALGISALRTALSAIIERHEALRTTFVTGEEEPEQIVAPPRPFDLPVVDVGSEAGARGELLTQAIQRQAARPFDLSRDLLLRGMLVRLAAEDHVLVLVAHHIACDEWSVGLLLRELGTLYNASCRGIAAPLPPLPGQYRDYAVRQRAELRGASLDRLLAYWRRRLAGIPALLALPTDRPRPEIQTHRGAEERRILPTHLVSGLRALSREQQVTLFMTLLAAFQALLGREAATDDVAVGTAIAGRRADVEHLIGCFVNTLVMRADLSGDPAFITLLARVKEGSLAAYEHQDLPFERLVQELRPPRNAQWTPVVQVLFAFQPEGPPVPALSGIEASVVETKADTSMVDLSVSLRLVGDELHAGFFYNTDLYDAASIRGMVTRYERLLGAIVSNPQGRLSALFGE